MCQFIPVASHSSYFLNRKTKCLVHYSYLTDTHTQNLQGNHGSIRNWFYIVTWEKLDKSPLFRANLYVIVCEHKLLNYVDYIELLSHTMGTHNLYF